MDLAISIADERDGADILDGLENLLDLFVDDRRELFRRARARDDECQHRRGVRIGLGDDRRQRILREVARGGADFVAHVLRGALDIALEHERDIQVGAARIRARPQLVDAVDGVDGFLERLGELCLDFLGAGAGELNVHVDHRHVGLRHQVEAELPVREPPDDDDRRRDHDGEHRALDADARNDHGALRRAVTATPADS